MLVLTRLPVHGSYARDLLVGLIPFSIGSGLALVPLTVLGTSAIAGKDSGLASGLYKALPRTDSLRRSSSASADRRSTGTSQRRRKRTGARLTPATCRRRPPPPGGRRGLCLVGDRERERREPGGLEQLRRHGR